MGDRYVACRIRTYNGKAHLKVNVQECYKRDGCGNKFRRSATKLKLLKVVNYITAMQSIVPFYIQVAPIIKTRKSAIHKMIFLCSKIAKANENQTKNSHSD